MWVEVERIEGKLLTKEELKQFLDVFLSDTERIMLAKRFLILYLLEKGNKVKEITDGLNVSQATVIKLNLKRKLDHQSYKMAFKKMDRGVLKSSLKDLAKTIGLKIAVRLVKGARRDIPLP